MPNELESRRRWPNTLIGAVQMPRQAAKAAAHARIQDAVERLFTPVEQGGALITTASKPRMVDMGNGQLVAAPIQDGYGWENVPKSVQKMITMHLPPGAKPVAFEASAMDDMQHNMVQWFGDQRNQERQQEAAQASADAAKSGQ